MNKGRTIITGEIEIIPRFDRGDDVYKICMNQIKTIEQNPEHIYVQTPNAEIVHRNIKYYALAGSINGLTCDTANFFTGDINTIIKAIEDISNK